MNKVLIIDDDRWFADAVAKNLHKHGWQTHISPDAAKGIEAIDDFKPNALLLDVMLPGSSAPAILNELQSHKDLADLPIVLCTSVHSDQFDLDALKSYGVRTVLDKAHSGPDDILKALQNAIS
ncbi:MAG: response regulator [Candidatus Saccharibacteria bacterium]|nr:response regulator [Candidatus Saccharibacteria bacterium]